MSASWSAWVWTKTSRAPGAAAASSSATRALRYFCCVVVTINTSQSGRIRRSRASVVSGTGSRSVRGHRSCRGRGNRRAPGSPATGRSCWTRSISWASMPRISGVSPGRQSRAGRVVVGRPRPERTSSAPARALISELLPVPVPPNVATTSGDSRRMRSEFSRPASRSMIAWQVSAGRQGGADATSPASALPGRRFPPRVRDGPDRRLTFLYP